MAFNRQQRRAWRSLPHVKAKQSEHMAAYHERKRNGIRLLKRKSNPKPLRLKKRKHVPQPRQALLREQALYCMGAK